MRRAFQFIEQLRNIVVVKPVRQPQFSGSDHEWLLRRPLRSHHSQTKKAVDHRLERGAGPPALFVQEAGNIVIEGKGGSHIMMIYRQAS